MVTWQVTTGGVLRDADEALSRRWRRPDAPPAGWVEWWAQLGADLGSLAVALPVLLAASAVLWWREAGQARLGGTRPPGGWWWPVAGYAGALAAVPLLVVPLKALVGRPGPLGGTGYYPSGHTATAVVAYGAAAALLAYGSAGRSVRFAVRAAAVLLVTACGTGLVVRGYHWPLDVVGSLLLGTGLLAVAAAITARRPRGAPPPRASPAPAPPDR
ncbi:phosphatase PAP2 family protein [Streptomyces sp. 549]|uniref:phosphatase PAP2 family protein n=1 Tax=Streptomyces sp. 549 TaxID=3049076 RepID=UPI0024C3384F|nr:phosphatase PAP2 family protein [Streptomyces sp. 549]MDK1475138.1 phosphatase PAP2 family protein [Streptomyces sp. 549]